MHMADFGSFLIKLTGVSGYDMRLRKGLKMALTPIGEIGKLLPVPFTVGWTVLKS